MTSYVTTPLENTTDTTAVVSSNVTISSGPLFDLFVNKGRDINMPPLIIVAIYCVCGLVGNAIVVYIYLLKWKKNTTRIFILCLAVLDLVNCVINMPLEIAVLWQFTFDHHYLCKLSRGLTYIMNNTGALVFVSVAIERWILVYHPLKSRRLTPTFAKGMCLASFIIASIFSWPSFVFYGTQTLYFPTDSVTFKYKTCLISDEHQFDKGWPLIFAIVLFNLLFIVFIILIVLYIAIGRKIYLATCTDTTSQDTTNRKSSLRLLSKGIISAITGVSKPEVTSELGMSRRFSRYSGGRNSGAMNKYENGDMITESSAETPSPPRPVSPTVAKLYRNESRESSTTWHQPTRKNTVMMRMVTIAFMVSYMPFLIILLIRYTNKYYYYDLGTAGKIIYNVFLRSYFINSMVNPFIYGFMDLEFRRLVKDMLRNIFCSNCCSKKTESQV